MTRVRSVLASFGWAQWLLAAVFVVALIAAGMFAMRTVRYTLYWSQHRNEPIERWMTVHYVAHSYDVPADVLFEALGLPAPSSPLRRDRRPLSAIAAAQGQSFDQVRTTLEQAIARERGQSPPSSSSSATPGPRGDRGAP